jgi:hypothetical protein
MLQSGIVVFRDIKTTTVTYFTRIVMNSLAPTSLEYKLDIIVYILEYDNHENLNSFTH